MLLIPIARILYFVFSITVHSRSDLHADDYFSSLRLTPFYAETLISTIRLKSKISAFWLRSVFMCFVWFSNKTLFISLFGIVFLYR